MKYNSRRHFKLLDNGYVFSTLENIHAWHLFFYQKFNEDTATIKELIFSSPLLFKKHTHSVTNVWGQPVTERSSIFTWQYTNGIFTINNNSLQRLVLAFFALEVWSPFWTEFSNAKWNKFIETGAAIFAKLWAGIIFIFTRVSRECQWRQKQGDTVIFRALFVFTRPITHAQFANCWACLHAL